MARSSKPITMRQMVTIPANESGIAGVVEQRIQGWRFHVAIAKGNIGFILVAENPVIEIVR